MPQIDEGTRKDIRELVYTFFARECDIPRENLTDSTNIITELEGDSLMLLSLLEMVRKKYGLTIELKTLGRHLMRKPAGTIGQVVALTLAIVQHGDNIINVDV
jgi:acyl carrier protein